MTTDQKHLLKIEPGMDSFRVECLEPGPAPTVSVSAGDYMTVEIDVTRTIAPVSVTIHDTERAVVSLCDLFGTGTAREILRRGTFSRPGQADNNAPLAFEPSSAWDGLLAAAYQEWSLYWNPLPLDGPLFALDTIAAAHRNYAFDDFKTGRVKAAEAIPAARALERMLEVDAIATAAVVPVRLALEALRHYPLPKTPEPETSYTLPLPLTNDGMKAILDAPASTPGRELLVIGSPDWRLTGHGSAASAEDTIHVSAHVRNPEAITITVPMKTTPGTESTYDATITEPYTGNLIAHATLRPGPHGLFRGHTIPVRPIRLTDHVDIRHPELLSHPEPSPERRSADRLKRETARKYLASRLVQSTHEGAVHLTLAELALSGRLLETSSEAHLTTSVGSPLFEAAVDPQYEGSPHGGGKTLEELRAPAMPKDAFKQLLSRDQFVLAAASDQTVMTGTVELGEITGSWSVDSSGAGALFHVAMNAPTRTYPDLSLVRLRVTANGETSTYYIVFHSTDEDLLFAEFTTQLPIQRPDILLDVTPIQANDLESDATNDIVLSILGCKAEGRRAWKRMAASLPSDSAPVAALNSLLRPE
ncbi:hypothetical protein J7I84_05285 [Arthrobacter sp. ISL-85]|uniref:hypothetical protein n=1 Tax=Arthrobacter sp. ISL-85 TaxID=2819115 RepID=UPI001BE979C4|nr:hypothetical protein [Arthrobacter sp. ISL-85]MBT2565918.1 hypothetical protein [Arthrobacter sp. ISL-85]